MRLTQNTCMKSTENRQAGHLAAKTCLMFLTRMSGQTVPKKTMQVSTICNGKGEVHPISAGLKKYKSVMHCIANGVTYQISWQHLEKKVLDLQILYDDTRSYL